MFPGNHVGSTPDKPAVVMADSGQTLTYAQLEDRSLRVARLLAVAGLRPGDGVSILIENRVEFYEVYWGAMRSGMYVTPVNTHFKPAEIDHILNDSGSSALFASARYAETLAGLSVMPKLRVVVGGNVADFSHYENALAEVDGSISPPELRGSDMLYSSGTTGRPKGIRRKLSQQPVASYRDPLVDQYGVGFGFNPDMVFLSPAPLYHGAPLRFSRMVHEYGGTVVLMSKFDAAAALATVERHRVTHTQWVPTMFIRMLRLPDEARLAHDLSSQRVAIHSAAPCPPEVKRRMIEWWGPILEEYYSSVEAIGGTIIRTAEWLERPGSVGRACLGTLHICNEAGDELPTREVGLIYFERDTFPFEYHNDPDKTRAAQHPTHPTWGTAGDLGYLDSDGYLYLTDRKSFMIISGGVNIYPQEVEDALALHPLVYDVAVVGRPNDEMGEEVLAVVEPTGPVTDPVALERQLIEFLRERIAHYKVPRSVVFASDLPRTETGKLEKYKVRDRYAVSAQQR